MTTVAYKDGIVAYDSQITDRSTVIFYTDKGKVLGDGRFAVACGQLSSIQSFYRWVDCPSQWDAPDVDEGFEALVFDPVDKNMCWYGHTLMPVCISQTEPIAIGSGMDLARGAMAMGATAYEALTIACRLNIDTGGEIKVRQVWTF